MEKFENIEEIVLRVLSGSASAEEKAYVDEWKNTNGENLELFEEYKKTNQVWNNYSLALKIDTKKGIDKLNKKLESKNKSQSVFLKYARVAAILLPFIFASAIYFYLAKDNPLGLESSRKVISSYGTRNKITLPDGSVVWLNAGSSIEYPMAFTGGKREVILTGEGYFDVVKNPDKPFYVKAENMYVKALGTSFNVRVYPGEDRIEATLLSGNVHLVTRKANEETTLAKMKPDQHVVFKKDENKLTLIDEGEEIREATKNIDEQETNEVIPLQAKVSTNKHTSWISGKLIFRNDSMEEIARRLGRWYNVDIIIADKEVKDYNYTATFTNETLEQILDLLKLSAPIEYKISKRDKEDDESFSKKQVIIRLRK